MNYKIKITAENREAIKEIADRNGMNPQNVTFDNGWDRYIENNIFPKAINFKVEHQELTFEQFKAMFDKQEALVGRYFKALEHKAQGSEIIEGEFYKIEYENEERIFFKVLTYRDGSHTFILDKKYENIYYELMPIGFDPSNQESQKIIHYIDAVDDIEIWNWFCENFDSKEYMNKMGNFHKNWKYFVMLDEGLKPIFVTQDVKDTENQKFVKLTLKEFKEKYMKNETQETDLEKWLRETKAKNLSLLELIEFIANDDTCSVDIYNELEKLTKGKLGKECAQILYNQWNEPKPQAKIIGYKAPFDLGGHEVKGLTFKLTPSDFGKWYQCCYGDSHELSEIILPSEVVETWEPVFEDTPTEIEFKEEMLGEIVPPNKVTIVETEWQPKRGDRVLDNYKDKIIEIIDEKIKKLETIKSLLIAEL